MKHWIGDNVKSFLVVTVQLCAHFQNNSILEGVVYSTQAHMYIGPYIDI